MFNEGILLVHYPRDAYHTKVYWSKAQDVTIGEAMRRYLTDGDVTEVIGYHPSTDLPFHELCSREDDARFHAETRLNQLREQDDE